MHSFPGFVLWLPLIFVDVFMNESGCMHCAQCQIEGAELINLDVNNNCVLYCPHVGSDGNSFVLFLLIQFFSSILATKKLIFF
jgi:hypothetical protein